MNILRYVLGVVIHPTRILHIRLFKCLCIAPSDGFDERQALQITWLLNYKSMGSRPACFDCQRVRLSWIQESTMAYSSYKKFMLLGHIPRSAIVCMIKYPVYIWGHKSPCCFVCSAVCRHILCSVTDHQGKTLQSHVLSANHLHLLSLQVFDFGRCWWKTVHMGLEIYQAVYKV